MICRLRSSALALATLLFSGATLAQPAGSSGSFPEAAAGGASQPSREQCLEAHRNAQELKQSGKFLEAQSHLVVCSSATCPGVVISDCGSWIGDLEQMTPSMIFEIRANGKEAPDAKVFVDDKPVTDMSHAVKVNPGRHAIRVELPPFPPHEETLTLPEGQRMRLVAVDFRSKAPEAAPLTPEPIPPAREPERPTPFIVYPLVGLGVAGLASFGVFSYLGRQKQTDLEETCAPLCTDAELEPMQKLYLIGDISAGVGAAALVTSAIVYFTRPEKHPTDARADFAVNVGAVAGGPLDSFGVNAAGSF
jgi:hypothetical protein